MAIGEKTELDLGTSARSGGAPEQKLFGRYTLKRVLGRGGMGIVWLAADDELKRNVAMKFLPDMLIRDREAVEDLKRETRRSLDLTHHHIVRIYDFTQDDACAAIIMEYVDGETLSSMKTQQPGGCFGVSVAAPWIGHFCMALDYAHRQARVVHRDLKPANLMVNGRGDLKVTDFGISRSMSDSMTRVSVSNTAGTLAYMSPEQALGAPPAPGDDVYAFGATVFDLLTGRPPFFRGNLQVQLETVIPPPMMERRAELGNNAEPIPALWEEVIAACLAKRPQDRPQSLGEVGSMLGVAGPSSTGGRAFFGGFAGGLPGTHSTNTAQPGTSPTQARTMMPDEMATRADGSVPGTSPGTARAVPTVAPAPPSKGAVRATSLNDIIPGYDAASAPARPSNRTAPVQQPATARPATQPVRTAAPASQPPATRVPAPQPPVQPATVKPPTQEPPSRPGTLSRIEPSEDDAAHTIIAKPARAKAAPVPPPAPVTPPAEEPEPAPVEAEAAAEPESVIAELEAAEVEVVADEMPPIIEEAEIVESEPEPLAEAEVAAQVEFEPEPIPEEVTMRRVEPAYESAPEAEVAPEAPATARIKIPASIPPIVEPVSQQAQPQPYQTSTGIDRGVPIASPRKSKAGLFAGVAVAVLAIGIAAWLGTRHGDEPQEGQANNQTNQTNPVEEKQTIEIPVVPSPAEVAAPLVAEANSLFAAGNLDAALSKVKEALAKDPLNQGARELQTTVETKMEADRMAKQAQDKKDKERGETEAAVVAAEGFLKEGKLDEAEEAVMPSKIPPSYALEASVKNIRDKIKDARESKREKMIAAQKAKEDEQNAQAAREKEENERKSRTASTSGSTKRNQTSTAEKNRAAERERESREADKRETAAANAAAERRKLLREAEAQSNRPPATKESGPKRTRSAFGNAPGNG